MSERSQNRPEDTPKKPSPEQKQPKDAYGARYIATSIAETLQQHPKLQGTLFRLLEEHKIILESTGGIEVTGIEGDSDSWALSNVTFFLRSDATRRSWKFDVDGNFRKTLVEIVVHNPSIIQAESQLNEALRKRGFDDVELMLKTKSREREAAYVMVVSITYTKPSLAAEKNVAVLDETFTYEFPSGGKISDEAIADCLSKLDTVYKTMKKKGEKMELGLA